MSFALIKERITEIETLCDGLRDEIDVIQQRKKEWLKCIDDCNASEDGIQTRLSEYELVLTELSSLLNKSAAPAKVHQKVQKNGKNVRGPLLDWRPLLQALPTSPEEALPISILRDIVGDEELAEKNRHKFRDQLSKWEKHGVVGRRKTGTRTYSWYRIITNNGSSQHI